MKRAKATKYKAKTKTAKKIALSGIYGTFADASDGSIVIGGGSTVSYPSTHTVMLGGSGTTTLGTLSSEPDPDGYRVTFEIRADGILKTKTYPEGGENLIKTEEEAWFVAEGACSGSNSFAIDVATNISKFEAISEVIRLNVMSL